MIFYCDHGTLWAFCQYCNRPQIAVRVALAEDAPDPYPCTLDGCPQHPTPTPPPPRPGLAVILGRILTPAWYRAKWYRWRRQQLEGELARRASR